MRKKEKNRTKQNCIGTTCTNLMIYKMINVHVFCFGWCVWKSVWMIYILEDKQNIWLTCHMILQYSGKT